MERLIETVLKLLDTIGSIINDFVFSSMCAVLVGIIAILFLDVVTPFKIAFICLFILLWKIVKTVDILGSIISSLSVLVELPDDEEELHDNIHF